MIRSPSSPYSAKLTVESNIFANPMLSQVLALAANWSLCSFWDGHRESWRRSGQASLRCLVLVIDIRDELSIQGERGQMCH